MTALASILANSTLYALAGLALLVLQSVTRTINLALGEIVIVGALVATLMAERAGLAMGILAAVAAGAVCNLLVDRVLLLQRTRSSLDEARDMNGDLAIGFGMSIVLLHLLSIVTDGYTARAVRFDDYFGGNLDAVPAAVQGFAGGWLVAVIALVATWLVAKRYRFDLILRAMEGNPILAWCFGWRIERIRVVSVLVAGACLAVFGVLLFDRLGAVSPYQGSAILFRALAVSVMAGRLDFRRVLGAALSLGVVEVLAGRLGGELLMQVVPYLLLATAVVFLRPSSRLARPA